MFGAIAVICLIGLVAAVWASYDLNITKQFSLGGKSYNHTQVQSAGGINGIEETISISWQGTLTTRTGNNDGVVTMSSASHPFTTGNKVDIYWVDATGRWQSQQGFSATVAGTALTAATGTGTNLPAQGTTVFVSLVQVFTFNTIGNQSVALLGTADNAACSIVLLTGVTVHLTAAININEVYEWTTGNGANPLAGFTIDTIHMSQSDSVSTHNVRFVSQLNI